MSINSDYKARRKLSDDSDVDEIDSRVQTKLNDCLKGEIEIETDNCKFIYRRVNKSIVEVESIHDYQEVFHMEHSELININVLANLLICHLLDKESIHKVCSDINTLSESLCFLIKDI